MSEFQKHLLPDPLAYYESQGLVLQPGRNWRTTRCEFHGGSDSMRIHAGSGAFVCMAGCGARGGDVLAYHMAAHGLDFISAAKDLGAWLDDGKPTQPRRPKPLPAAEAIQVLAFESHLTSIAASNMAQGVPLSYDDRARLHVAARRIQTIAEVFHA